MSIFSITRHVDVVSAIYYNGRVRAEIIDRVAEQGPENFSYEINILSFSNGREATRHDPPEPAEYEHDGYSSNAAGDILAMIVCRHGDYIQLCDAADIVSSIQAYEIDWIDTHLADEVFDEMRARKEYFEESRWDR